MHENERPFATPACTERTKSEHASTRTRGLNETKRDLGLVGPVLIAETLEQISGDILSGHHDTPESGEADHGKQRAKHRAGA